MIRQCYSSHKVNTNIINIAISGNVYCVADLSSQLGLDNPGHPAGPMLGSIHSTVRAQAGGRAEQMMAPESSQFVVGMSPKF